MLDGKDQAYIWRELERIEQRLSKGAVTAGRLCGSIGRPGAQTLINFSNQMVIGIARVDRVRQALDQSAPMAQRLAVQQLSGIELSAVWDILISACKEIVLCYGGAVVAGAVIGGSIGSLAFGIGAAPGAMIGTVAGAQVGGWILALLGLKALAEGLGSMLPAALDHYERGFREAWGTMPEDRRSNWKNTAPASGNTHAAAWHMAQGHVIMVTAILTALVAYLTRGQGKKALLMHDIRNSPKLGLKFAEWLATNERKLLSHPQLRSRANTPAAMETGGSLPTNARGAPTPTSGNAGVKAADGAAPALKQVGMSRLALPRTEGLGPMSTTAELLRTGAIPGREGVILQQRTVPFSDIWKMSEKSGVEFVLTKESGGWMLRSGSSTSAPIPGGIRPILHTHPFDSDGVNSLLPSKADINVLNNYWARNPTIPRPVSQILTGQPEPTRFYATGFDPWN